MIDMIKEKMNNEFLVAITHDIFCNVEPEATFFWFPKMSEAEFESWWINTKTMRHYSENPFSLPGEVILADSDDLKRYFEEIEFDCHNVILVTDGDQGSILISPERGVLYHQGYVGPIHGTKYWSWELN